MVTYQQHGVTLSLGQRDKLSKALKTRAGITLRLSNAELSGNDKLLLTKTQIKKINKSKSQGKGTDIKLSVAQIRKMVKSGGSLISTLLSLGTRALPMVSNLATKVLPGLATGALSSLGNFGMDSILGRGQSGGFLIPQNKTGQLIAYKKYLTATQKAQLNKALQSGGDYKIKPTKKQRGGFLGTLLASIGVPMLLKALTGSGPRNRPRPGRGLQNRPRPGSGPRNRPRPGRGLQNRPASARYAQYRPPPFIGNWQKTMGSGKGKKKRKRSDTRTKLPIQEHTTSRPNFVVKPISNSNINSWIKYLKVKNFIGTYSRDQIHSIKKVGYYIINLDDQVGQGTHWVVLRLLPNNIEYFDSFGLRPPKEVKELGLPYVYNSTQYQDLESVLCGYYCIYWINESYLGKDYWDIVKNLSQRYPHKNEEFVTNYFKNI